MNKTIEDIHKYIKQNESLYRYQSENYEKNRQNLRKIEEVQAEIREDKELYTRTLRILKNAYNTYKEETLIEIQEKINILLNDFFDNNHTLKLTSSVSRGKTNIKLTETTQDGRELGSLGLMLSGAEQQLFGFMIQQTTLANLGSNFLILDEAFSSFGIKEVTILASILEAIEGTQMLIIEHKDGLFDEFNPYTVELTRGNTGTSIKDLHNTNNMVVIPTRNQIQDLAKVV